MFGFRLKAKSEHEATLVFGWYGEGGKETRSNGLSENGRAALRQSPRLAPPYRFLRFFRLNRLR